MKPIAYKVILVTCIVAPILIYAILFDRLSETDMVRLAYLWLPGILFGATGLMRRQGSLRLPLLVAGIGLALLFVFFETIWPKL